jgi:uncharacterized MAPEG superfamily protein
MTTDLRYLAWSVILTLAQVVLSGVLAAREVGGPTLAGNRDNMPALTGIAGRASRAHRNLLENIVLFAILVLTARVADRANGVTALGATVFFWARVAYVPAYLIGPTGLRPVVWGVSISGLLLIFSQLLG